LISSLNLDSLYGDVGVSHTALAEWLDVLEASFIVFRLEPYHANIRKCLRYRCGFCSARFNRRRI
jgi:predicted AAA+ superfamily ATPase